MFVGHNLMWTTGLFEHFGTYLILFTKGGKARINSNNFSVRNQVWLHKRQFRMVIVVLHYYYSHWKNSCCCNFYSRQKIGIDFLSLAYVHNFFFPSQNRARLHPPAPTPRSQTPSTLCWPWCAASVFWCSSCSGLSVSATGRLTLSLGMLINTLITSHALCFVILSLKLNLKLLRDSFVGSVRTLSWKLIHWWCCSFWAGTLLCNIPSLVHWRITWKTEDFWALLINSLFFLLIFLFAPVASNKSEARDGQWPPGIRY